MHIEWTNHLKDPIEKEQFKGSYHGSKTVLDRLAQMLEGKIASIESSTDGMKQYQSPNWAYETAHKNGLVSAYNAVKELVTVRDQ